MTAKFGGRGVRVSGCAAASRKQRGRWNLLLLIVAAFAVSQLGMPSVAAAQKKKVKTKVNPKDGLTYVWIPAGKFMMGCSAGDTHCAADQKPAHLVTITKGFWIGQTEVTQKAFVKVARANPKFLHAFQEEDEMNHYPVAAEGDINPSIFKGPDLPVEQLRWAVAGQYCEAVGMRLPTEAEWEYAARGGSDKPTWGPLGQIAWYNTAPLTVLPYPPDGNGSTHPVAQKEPNGYGLYDILGNVWEWTADWYGPYAAAAQVDPTGPEHGVDRVMRGGGWDTGAPLSVSTRGHYEPWVRGGNFGGDRGVRCVGN
jgi:formylglycine-generating enzyme required for sulfatase activity